MTISSSTLIGNVSLQYDSYALDIYNLYFPKSEHRNEIKNVGNILVVEDQEGKCLAEIYFRVDECLELAQMFLNVALDRRHWKGTEE